MDFPTTNTRKDGTSSGIAFRIFCLSDDQPVCCQRHIPHGDQEPPYEDYTADNGADQKVKGKDGNAPTEGTAAGDDPKKHTVYPKRQTAQEP